MSESNANSRLEAFCDGVFAFALTLLIVDVRIPSSTAINDSADFWLALRHLAPSVFAFLLSFIVILITWVNHRACLKLVDKSSPLFMYANGLLLLTVVFIPFPTALLGNHILTDHAAPAVFLYNGVMALQGFAWIMLAGSAIKDRLSINERSTIQMHTNRRNGYYAFLLYFPLAIVALWFPVIVAVFATLTWIFWLIFGISIKHECIG